MEFYNAYLHIWTYMLIECVEVGRCEIVLQHLRARSIDLHAHLICKPTQISSKVPCNPKK